MNEFNFNSYDNSKQTIMIDGVDVSGCCQYMPRYMEDYDIDALDYCRYHFKPCKDVGVKYCYYKQLKRKEQQLKDFENEYEGFAVKYTDMEIALKRKEEECKKLRFPMEDNNYAILTKEEFENFKQLKADNEKMEKGYIELLLDVIELSY